MSYCFTKLYIDGCIFRRKKKRSLKMRVPTRHGRNQKRTHMSKKSERIDRKKEKRRKRRRKKSRRKKEMLKRYIVWVNRIPLMELWYIHVVYFTKIR